MTWFSRLFAGQDAPDPGLTARQQQLLANWRQLPAPDMRRSHYRCRYVVVDVETTGIDVKNDRLCSIGALAVVDGQIDFKDAFQRLLADAVPSADPALASAAGLPAERRAAPPVDALLAFLDFAGKGPMLAYNVPFVAAMIERAFAEGLRVELGLPWIDLAWVLPDLFRNIDPAQGGLDAWLSHFGIESIHRHNAVSDAYVTAQLLQITIASGARSGFATPASLLELEKARRHMHQSG